MLNANLVSVSALDKARLTMIFSNGKGVIQKADGTVVLTGQNVNGMYLLETIDGSPNPSIAMTSLSQPTSLEQWHWQLTHCSLLTIQEMSNKGLVNRLIISEKGVNGKCEDCIMHGAPDTLTVQWGNWEGPGSNWPCCIQSLRGHPMFSPPEAKYIWW